MDELKAAAKYLEAASTLLRLKKKFTLAIIVENIATMVRNIETRVERED